MAPYISFAHWLCAKHLLWVSSCLGRFGRIPSCYDMLIMIDDVFPWWLLLLRHVQDRSYTQLLLGPLGPLALP